MSKKNIIMALLAISFIGGGDAKGIGLGKAVSSWNQNRSNTNGASRVVSSGLNSNATVSKLVSRVGSSGLSSRATVSQLVSKARSSGLSSRATASKPRTSAPTLRSLEARLKTIISAVDKIKGVAETIGGDVTNLQREVVAGGAGTFKEAVANIGGGVTNLQREVVAGGAGTFKEAVTKIGGEVTDIKKEVVTGGTDTFKAAVTDIGGAVTDIKKEVVTGGTDTFKAAVTKIGGEVTDIKNASSGGNSSTSDRLTGFISPAWFPQIENNVKPAGMSYDLYNALQGLNALDLISTSGNGIPYVVNGTVKSYLNQKLAGYSATDIESRLPDSTNVPVKNGITTLDSIKPFLDAIVAGGGWNYSAL